VATYGAESWTMKKDTNSWLLLKQKFSEKCLGILSKLKLEKAI